MKYSALNLEKEHNTGVDKGSPLNSKVLGFANDGESYLITTSGHFSAGKTEFEKNLRMQMAASGSPVVGVINYKSRGPRATELQGIDYMPIESEKDFRRLIQEGKIVVPYTHDNHRYGLSSEFAEALEKKNIPIMITDALGLVNLIGYLKNSGIPNKLISFMLHTSKSDARERLFVRAGAYLGREEIEGIRTHMETLEDEFEVYKNHEGLFRHVFRNNTVDGVSKEERIQHLTSRGMDILNLERRLNKETAEEFREAYVEHVVNRLFSVSTASLLNSTGQGVYIDVPKEVLQRYSHEQRIDLSAVEKAVRKEVLHAAKAYGILTLYLSPTMQEQDKKILTEVIQKAVKLTPQYTQLEIMATKTSDYSLKQMEDDSFTDFISSFSPYDPMKTPSIDSRLHTITFENLLLGTSPIVEAVPFEQAKKIIEGNGK